MTFDALRRRVQIPFPWAITIFAVLTVGVFAGTWLSGSPVWLVVVSTLVVALLTGIGLTTTGPARRNRTFRLLAHVVLGAFVLFAALLVTVFGVAAGELTLSLVNLVVLGSIWGLGVALVVSGILFFLDANQLLLRVATVGLALTVVWGLVVVVTLGGVAAHLLVDGFDFAIVQDVRDDLVPLLVISVAFVVLPALVFRQDRNELRSHEATRG